jgi:DNA primase
VSVVDEVRQRTDIVDLVGSYVQLQRAGRNYKGLCPFHTEKTPSFIVFPESQRWHCFGACSTGGDVFNFVMRRENMDFGEALRLLAERAGVALEPLTVEAIEHREERDRLREINAAAALHYHRLLMESPAGEAAREYLARRGVTRETMVTFQLGYAPDEWRSAEGALAPVYGHEDLLTAGIISRSERGGHYDRFRNRLMFPIRDPQGHVIGFGGRVLDDSVPKYLNSPDTPLFDKGAVLYGLDLAREEIRETGTVVVVEGYMDVVVPYQSGVRNLVACLGTALTEAHIGLLRRLVRVLILALDPDEAGLRATERGIETAQQALDRRTVPVLTPAGAVRYESRLDAEVRVLVLPDGLDPDELVLQDRARWDRLVAEALPVAEFYFRRVLDEEDLTTAKGKANAVERLLPVIGAIDNPAERQHYLQALARRVRVDEAQLQPALDRLRGRAGPGQRQGPRRADARPPVAEAGVLEAPTALSLEARVTALLYAFPGLLVEARDVANLRPEAFSESLHRGAYEALLAQAEREGLRADPVGALDTPLRGHVESLLHALGEGPPLSLETAREDLVKSAIRLRQVHLTRFLRELRFLLEDAQEAGDAEQVHQLNALIDRCTKEHLEIHRQSYAVTLLGRSRRGSD